mgnify:FL=1
MASQMIRFARFDDPIETRTNGRRKMSSMNSTVIVDHDGMFIYVDPEYPGSFYDITIIRQSELHKNCRDYLTHNDELVEYFLGDPG